MDVYGRCNELVFVGGYFMAYKPTYNWGTPIAGWFIKENPRY
jgi:hypothetical protein